MSIKSIIKKAENGETLSDDELTDLYCEAPEILARAERAEYLIGQIARGELPPDAVQFRCQRFLGI